MKKTQVYSRRVTTSSPWRSSLALEVGRPTSKARETRTENEVWRLAFLARDDFHRRSSFARSTIPKRKWETTRMLYLGVLDYESEELIACVAAGLSRKRFCAV